MGDRQIVLETPEDADRNRYLAVAVELASEVPADDTKRRAVAQSILIRLRRLNSRCQLCASRTAAPSITLRPLGDPEYFPLGVKHRYTQNERIARTQRLRAGWWRIHQRHCILLP
ncbi:MAG: hypothetical protein U0074_25945 [Kouleothrix sp.]